MEIAEDYDTYVLGRAADAFVEWADMADMPPGDFDLYQRTDVMGTVSLKTPKL